MKFLNNSLQMYKKVLQETDIQETYRALIASITKLQGDFKNDFHNYVKSLN
ncbi:hypothetical protein [Clostridium sp.]|uniref:DUF7000 family protein n=1 Tax=Clostridium sp. TaxID=1506 RepID=UPI0034648B3C